MIRLPPVLPDLDENLKPQNADQPPLVEVVDLDRAIRRLSALGLEVGPIEEEGWEAIARLTIPELGTFRLIGPWLPGWSRVSHGDRPSSRDVPGSSESAR